MTTDQPEQAQVCPSCGQSVHPDATLCVKCNHYWGAETSTEPQIGIRPETRRSWRGIWMSLLLLIPIVGIGIWYQSSSQIDGLPEGENLTPADCVFKKPTGYVIHCGYLTVPADHNQREVGEMRLFVAVVRSAATVDVFDRARPDPLLYLNGGPGGTPFYSMDQLINILGQVHWERDIVFVSQRGTPFAQPSLECPEDDGERSELLAAELCYERLLAEGIDVSNFSTVANAHDMILLRQALGYKSWNIYGVSYGTRLALVLMQLDEAGIRSVVLDSVYPTDVSLYSELVINAQRSFDLLFARCASNEFCRREFPDLQTVFYDLAESWEREPVSLEVMSWPEREESVITLQREELVRILFNSMYNTYSVPFLPDIIYRFHNGDLRDIRRSYWITGQEDPDTFSLGMHLSLQCAEDMNWLDENQLLQNREEVDDTLEEGLLPLVETMMKSCQFWGDGEPDPVFGLPIESDLPTLLLAGDYDPITPPSWTHHAAETLSSSFVYTFPSVGHGVIFDTRDCGRNVMTSFLNNPSDEPMIDCIAELNVFFLKRPQ